ncbi:MAG TPA: hypothetical protein VFD56_13475 [Chitinophagaceae bacterium]|nr:hypothetical protein [Chitinophagaceae bacterium]
MMLLNFDQRWHAMFALSLILAPALQALSTFFWVDGEYGVTGGTILVFSMVFWIPALLVLFSFVKNKMPNYAAWGFLIAVYGFVSGVNFGFLGVLTEIFSISHESYIREFSKYPISSNLLLFQAGPLAPLSLVILGIVFLYTKVVDWKIGLLIMLGGIAFPLSRISRIELAAHIADILQLIPLALLGGKILMQRKTE